MSVFQGFLEEVIYPGTSAGLTGGSMLGSELDRLRRADPYYYAFRQAEIGILFWPDVRRSSMRSFLLRNSGLSFDTLGTGNVFFVQ